MRTGKWDGARVEIIEVDWSALTSERHCLSGSLVLLSSSGNQYNATLNSMEIGVTKADRTHYAICDVMQTFGDSRCGYALTLTR